MVELHEVTWVDRWMLLIGIYILLYLYENNIILGAMAIPVIPATLENKAEVLGD